MYINISESNAGYTALAIVCFAAGFALNFLGARYFRTAVVACGIFAGGDYVAMAMSTALDGFTEEATYWTAFWVGGILIGFFAFLNLGVGVGIAGFLAGAQATLLIVGMASYTGQLSLQVVWASCGGVLAVFTGLLLASRKTRLAMATSFSGATLFIDGVRHIVNYNILVDGLMDTSDRLLSAWWMLAAVTIALFVVGVLIQLTLTAWSVDNRLQARATPVNAQAERVILPNFGRHDEYLRPGYFADRRRAEADGVDGGQQASSPQFVAVASPAAVNKNAAPHAAGNPIAYA